MRLIDADNALELFQAEYQNTKNLIKQGEKHLDSLAEGYTEAAHIIKHISPTVDAVPVVHGRWVKHYRSGTTVAEGYVSTCCDMWNNRKSDYCPNCGARMNGDSDALD